MSLSIPQIIECASLRGFSLGADDAMDIIQFAKAGESAESATCEWLLINETCDPNLEVKFGLPASTFA